MWIRVRDELINVMHIKRIVRRRLDPVMPYKYIICSSDGYNELYKGNEGYTEVEELFNVRHNGAILQSMREEIHFQHGGEGVPTVSH